MPLYEYECRKCHHRFELIEKVGAPETRKCPKCGSKADRRLAPPAIQFKGSGWYVTDYAGKGSSGASSAENSEKSAKTEKTDGAGKSGSKDAKPEKSASIESKPTKKS